MLDARNDTACLVSRIERLVSTEEENMNDDQMLANLLRPRLSRRDVLRRAFAGGVGLAGLGALSTALENEVWAHGLEAGKPGMKKLMQAAQKEGHINVIA